MKTVILDRETLGADLDISVPFDTELIVFENTKPYEVVDRISDADIIFLNKVILNEENLSKAKKLKLICEAATGYDNIDIDYCRKRGIAVCNVPGYSTYSVSQVSVAMVMSLANHIKEYRSFTASGKYTESGSANSLTPVFHELNGLTWGIVGYGNIGSAVGKVAKALGCNVLAYKRTPTDEVACVDIDTLIQKSDIITVHIPLSDSTRNLINKKRIAMMKPNAIFVNTARGAIADEEALCEAVKNGKIGAIGIDVYSKEPFDEKSPYFNVKDLDNVCLTPHMAWGAQESRKRCFSKMIENTNAFLEGKILNRVDI